MVCLHECGDTIMAATFKEKKKKKFGHLTDKHFALEYLHFECATSASVSMYMPSNC